MAKTDLPLTRTEDLLRLAEKDRDEEVREAVQIVREGIPGIILNMKYGIRNKFMELKMFLPTSGDVNATMDLTRRPAEEIAEYDAETFLLAGTLDSDPHVRRASAVLFDEMKRLLEEKTDNSEKPTVRRPDNSSPSDSVQAIAS